jgi:endo-1,4-beta-D-glucanase Y
MRAKATIVGCVLGLFVTGCGSAKPASGSSADRLATDAASAFLKTYTTDGGRIQRIDQGGDTVGEGQAYGLLAAAALGDEHRFDQIWTWTQDHMMDSSGLLAFHWVDGRVVDPTPAADADLDAARALLVASCRFGRSDLRSAAIRIGQAVLAHETARAGSTEVLLAGPWANQGSHLVVDPSYVDPTTLLALANATGDSRFGALAADGSGLVEDLMMPLPPDWAIVDTATAQVTPVSGPDATGGPGMFTYDAPRALVRLAENPDSAAKSAEARAWSVFRDTQPQDIVTVHRLNGTAVGDVHHPVTLVAAAGAAKAGGDTSAMTTLLNVAQQLNDQQPSYYGSAWVALGRLLLTTDRLQPCNQP